MNGNDLREKVTDFPELADNELPMSYADNGGKFYFSIAIMQYGLGCYDLYLETGEDKYLRKMLFCADWAVNNQDDNGGYKTFSHIYPNHPYSAMANGEGVSLLIRAYKESGQEKYLVAAKRAVDFLLTPVEQGGVAISTDDDLIFKEYTERPIVMNGWIFSLWGLFDYVKLTGDEKVKYAYEKTLGTLERYLPHYDIGYWSRYDYSERLASPQYHNLHIDQLIVLYDLTSRETFKIYKEKFEKYKKSFWCRKKAFVIKAMQKLRGK